MQNIFSISFTGEFHYTLDSKNRLSIPAKYRKSLMPENNGIFVISHGFDKQLVVYPIVEWLKVEEELNSLNSVRKKDRAFQRMILRSAHHVTLDASGRISIPDRLLSFAGIEKDITIIGMIKKFELWSPKRLSEFDSLQSDIDSEDFEDLAKDISF